MTRAPRGELHAGLVPEPSAPALSRAGEPGFWQGFMALPNGVRFLAERRRCWPAAAAPCAIVLALSLPLLWLALAEVGPRLGEWLLPHTGTWYEQSARWVVRWLGSALAAYAGVWIALLAAPTLSAPALEYLVRAREEELGVLERRHVGFWGQLRAGLEAQLGALLLSVPLWLFCWLLGFMVPAALLLLPLQAVPGAFTLAWNLLDYPLTLRGVRLRERWQLLRSHPGAVFGFALCLVFVACVPGGAFLLLPAGVVAAARLTRGLLPD